ncbi:MAG: MerR family transcriptional regulator [Desulfomonile tiedjei]|uniref:MerR family transcriptional regulator n=1 Tax=Desulfomonile tiedjei TaxID=2358 RepID=A0A9D6Z285_9BACT|nr:MerR family transcriptional regulator [Desulfomonile tiedjei]
MAINTIGTVSEITDIHPSSLRRWESQGYIRPLRMFLSGASHRIYTDAQVELLKRVKGYLGEGYYLKAAFRLAKQNSEQGEPVDE